MAGDETGWTRAALRRGDIYRVSLDPAFGREQRGWRPVLVVSPDGFNVRTGAPVVLPITNGGGFAKRSGFAVQLSGTRTTGVVRCDQPRVVDLEAREAIRVERVSEAILDDVLVRVGTLFAKQTSEVL